MQYAFILHSVDKSFLVEKLAGKEFEIICNNCDQKVKVTVTNELTGICPLCNYENALNFLIK